MTSLILRTISRYHLPLLLLFSAFLLLRGHNAPGGGFIGGLVASTGWTLYAIAFDASAARQVLRIDPQWLIVWGLSLALGSGLVGFVGVAPFLTAKWRLIDIPGVGEVHLGTPLLFDLGVYLLVIGATLTIILALDEE
jgi:multicomponent Na+:H+ antiporter subunit B